MRQSKEIVRVIGEREGKNFLYWEPFCGGMGSATAVIRDLSPSRVILSDVNSPLISLWNGLVFGDVVVPTNITDEVYEAYKLKKDMSDPLTAWYGFGCSFGGKWFGGLARYCKGRCSSYDMSGEARSLYSKVDILKRASNLAIINAEYEHLLGMKPEGFVVYADPPYEGRTKAHCFDKFDTGLFWDNMRKLSETNRVYVTCFDHPEDFVVLHDWGCTIVNHSASEHEILHDNITEKLVVYGGKKS